MKVRYYKVFLLFAFLILLTRLPFLAFIHRDCYSVDINGWKEVIEKLRLGQNPYETTRFLNWPPIWLIILFFLEKISTHTNLPIDIAIRCFLVFADIVMSLLLFGWISKKTSPRVAFKTIIVGYIFNPVFYFLTVQHGNFDILIGMLLALTFISLSVFIKNKQTIDWLAASCFLGLAIATKTVPIVFVPILIFCFFKFSESTKKIKSLLLGFFLIFMPVILSMSILYVLSPQAITEKVIKYHSTIGFGFGFPWILSILDLRGWIDYYKFFFIFILVFVILGSFKKILIAPNKLIDIFIILPVTIIVFGPGHGNQYILWFLPLLLLKFVKSKGFEARVICIFMLLAAITYTFEYLFLDYFGQSLLWYFQDSPALLKIKELLLFANQGASRFPVFISYLLLFFHLLKQE